MHYNDESLKSKGLIDFLKNQNHIWFNIDIYIELWKSSINILRLSQ